MRRVVLMLASLPLAGCVYFNGIYNAQRAEREADAMRRSGRTAQADSLYQLAASTADSVRAHHPDSRWAGRAELIAGWSFAMSSDCDRARPLLRSVLLRAAKRDTSDARATLALGICLIRNQHYVQGRAVVGPLARLRDSRLAEDASLWAAVASTILGEPDSARAYMLDVNGGRIEWQLSRIYLARGQWAPAESLLDRRAGRGDYRADVPGALRTLWRAGRAAAVEAIVAAYDSAQTSPGSLAALHVLTGELALGTFNDSLAREHYLAVARLARDSTLARDARAHLTLLALRDLTSLADVRTVIERDVSNEGGSALQRRLIHGLLLVELLHGHEDGAQAGVFLAAEVARDSLRAFGLARQFFQQVAQAARSPLAVRASRAAAALPLGAAPPGNALEPVITATAFGDVDAGPERAVADQAEAHVDALLERSWRVVLAQYADSLARLAPASVSARADATSSARDSIRP